MTKRGTFKQAVRNHAHATGKRYTEALSDFQRDEVAVRVFATGDWHGRERLPAHLEERYGISVSSMSQLSLHGGGVFRVDRDGGPSWVVRVFPQASRSIKRLEGDADILRFLEAHDFPAERCSHPEPVSVYDGQSALVTTFVAGAHATIDPDHEYALADMLGRLHSLPPGSGGTARPGGAWGHDPTHRGRPREDLAAAASFLAAIEHRVPERSRPLYECLRDDVAAADSCDDLPEALTRAGMAGRNVIVAPDGSRVAIDWKGAGRGPRLPAFAALLVDAMMKPDVTSPAQKPDGDPAIIDAIVSGYRKHVRLTMEELSRLAGAMRIYTLYFACWYFWRVVATGSIPDGTEGWWPDHAASDAVSAKATAALERP